MFMDYYQFTGHHCSDVVRLPYKSASNPCPGWDAPQMMYVKEDIWKYFNDNTYWTFRIIGRDHDFIDFIIMNRDTAIIFKMLFGGQ